MVGAFIRARMCACLYIRSLTRGKREREMDKLEQCHLTVHGHLINLRAVILFNVTQNTNVIVLDKIDGYSLSSVTT